MRRPVYRERKTTRRRSSAVCCGCGQMIWRKALYFYRQVAYEHPGDPERPIEWADEHLHYPCRWIMYALWSGEGREPCLVPWLPPLLRLLGEERLVAIEPSVKETYFAQGEEEIPGWKQLHGDHKKQLLKFARGQNPPTKPKRIRRLYIEKKSYPFTADPPWTAKEWVQIYAPHHHLQGGPRECNGPDRRGGAKADSHDVVGRDRSLEGRGGVRQEPKLAAQ